MGSGVGVCEEGSEVALALTISQSGGNVNMEWGDDATQPRTV